MNGEYPPPPTTPPQPPPAPERRRAHLLLAALAGTIIGAGAVGAAWAITGDSDPTAKTIPTSTQSPTLDGFTLTGTLALTDGVIDDGLGGCQGSEGYEDIFEGASVTVYDAADTVIATGQLGDSTLQDDGTCRFDVAVSDVPTGRDFYKVGITHRGTLQLTQTEAESGAFSATLG